MIYTKVGGLQKESGSSRVSRNSLGVWVSYGTVSIEYTKRSSRAGSVHSKAYPTLTPSLETQAHIPPSLINTNDKNDREI